MWVRSAFDKYFAYFARTARGRVKRDASYPAPQRPTWDLSAFVAECNSPEGRVIDNDDFCYVMPKLMLAKPPQTMDFSSLIGQHQIEMRLPCSGNHNPCPGMAWSQCRNRTSPEVEPLDSQYECKCDNYTGFTLMYNLLEKKYSSNSIEVCQDVNECDENMPIGSHMCDRTVSCLSS